MAKVDDKGLWVINTSGQVLTISVHGKGGRAGVVRLEKTWVPQDLSMQAQPKDILSSPEYRRSVALQVIRPQDPEQVAELFRRDPEALAEHQRIVSKGSVISSVLEQQPAEVKVVDTNKAATPEELLVTTVFGHPDEASVKNEIRVLRTANKLDEPGILALAKRAMELGYNDVLTLLQSYA